MKIPRGARGWRRVVIGILVAAMGLAGAGGATWYGSGREMPLPAPSSVAGTVVDRTAELLPGRDTAELEVLIGRVDRVVDGDTLVVTVGQAEERVRLLCVDTPESVHSEARRNTPAGRRAAEFTRELLEGRQVRLLVPPRDSRDNFGRLLAYVMLDGENINVRLVREGHSPYYVKYGRSPYFDAEFRRAEREAEEAGRAVLAN